MTEIVNLQTKIQQHFANVEMAILHEQITLQITTSDLIKVCYALRNIVDLQFNQLIDLCGVDYLSYGQDEWATTSATGEGFSRAVKGHQPSATMPMPGRFAVVYNLLSTVLNHRIRLKVFLPEHSMVVPTVTNVWSAANWYEREAFDLFGIEFAGHPDLRRILTDYDFVGHPFRKDFPLIGHVEMRYDAQQGKVIYEPVSIQPRTLVPKVIRQVGIEENV